MSLSRGRASELLGDVLGPLPDLGPVTEVPPSRPWNIRSEARCAWLRTLRSSLPANIRWSRAWVAMRRSASSTGSFAMPWASLLTGLPTGPLENSHT